MSLAAARFISSAVNPLLICCWLTVVFVAWRRGEKIWEFAAASVGAVITTYLIVHGFRLARVWPGHPMFPSGHETFAVSIVTSLVLRDVRGAILTPLLALLGIALVRAGYHDWLDIIGAALLTPPVVIGWHLLVRRWTNARHLTN